MRKKQEETDSEMLKTELLYFSFSLQDENPDLSHWLESSTGSRKVCVSWSNFEEQLLSVNLTLIQKLEDVLLDGSSPNGRNPSLTSVSVIETMEALAEEMNPNNQTQKLSSEAKVDSGDVKLISVSSPPLDYSTATAVATSFRAASNIAAITRTVYVTSLVDSAANVSLCSLTSPDQQVSHSVSVTSGGCNLRSAIEMCTSFLTTGSCVDASAACVVLLPLIQTIIMDPALEELKISSESLCGSLTVEGSGSVIRPSSSSPLSMRLLNVDLPVPSDGWFSLHINNLVIMNFRSSSVEGGAIRLNNLKSNFLSSVTNVIFRNNSGSHGGALVISSSETVVLGGNVFDGNTARGDAGGLFIDSDCENINITDCSFSYNTAMGMINTKPRGAAGLGGGAVINTRNSLISFHNCSFFNNVAIRGGGLGIYDSNDRISLTSISFLNNTANRFGGGIYIVYDNLYVTLTWCYFLGNTGEIDAGGLRLYSGNYYMTLLQCVFSGNSANGEGGVAYGGGIYLDSNNWYFTMKECHLSGNSVSNGYEGGAYGGGIYLYTTNWYFTLEHCTFSGNSVSSKEGGSAWGGGVYMFSGNSYLIMQACYFDDNSADTGGAVCLNAGNLYATLDNVTCRDNVARGDGGGLVVISGNNYLTVSDSSFTGNSAGTRGGGIYSALQNNDLQVTLSYVTGNSAVSVGGGVYIGESHEQVRFRYVDISENAAQDTAGGACFSRFSTEVVLSDCQIRNNSARTVGGLLVLADDMSITSSVFENNIAHEDYGAVYVQKSKSLEVASSNFSNNVAQGNCGAMSASQTESVTVKTSMFLSNSAETGGAVCVANGSRNTSFINTNFQHNVASVSAGALYVVSAVNVVLKASLFSHNTALTGDGSAIYISSSNVFFELNSFSGNKAPLGGGAVYWISSSGMQEPFGLSGSEAGNYFSLTNTALYGSWYATEPRYIISKNHVSSLKIVDYNKQAAPPITVLIQDWYYQTVLSDSSSSVTVSVSTSLVSDCYGEEGFIGGSTRLTLLSGSTTFDLLEPGCAPSYNLSLNIVSSLPSVVSLPFQYSFRSCVTGEYYAERACNPCEEGSYSFVDPSTLPLSHLNSDICQQCPSGAQRCFKDQIIIKEGHWRISQESNRVFECPLDESSCLGMNLTGESSCGEGYTGALCAVCGDGYHHLDTYQTCESCSGTRSLFDSFFVITICLAVVILVVCCYILKVKVIDRHHISSPDEFIAYFLIACRGITSDDFESNRTKTLNFIKTYRCRVQQRVKIYITLYQILVALPFVLSLNISTIFEWIMSALSFVNVGIVDSSLASCSLGSSFDFVDKLIFQTIYPLLVILLLAVASLVHIKLDCKENPLLTSNNSKVNEDGDNGSERFKIVSRYIYFGLIFINLILPYTSAVIFSTFSCKNIDPDSIEEGDSSFMTADYSVSCQSDRYVFAYIWAIAMIFVYPVGVPLVFAILLYRVKDDIVHRNHRVGSEKENADRLLHLVAIRSLYTAYIPEYWYWEVLETPFRLSLTGFLVIIAPGGYIQIVVGTVFALLYLLMHNSCKPYEDSELNVVKSISVGQIFSIFYLALISYAEFVNTSDWRFNAVIVFAVFFKYPLGVTHRVHIAAIQY